MPIPAIISYAAAYFSLIIAAAILLRDRHSLVQRAFAAGMFLFAVEELLRAYSYGAVLPEDVTYWQKRLVAVSAVTPGVWFAFSSIYARANFRSLFSKWKWAFVAASVAPLLFAAIFQNSLFAGITVRVGTAQWSIPFGWSGRILQFFVLILSVLILLNLERTVRSSVGRMRWQIKFTALGVGGLFALRIYLASQSLLFFSLDPSLGTLSALALIAANLLFSISLSRGRSLDVDVYLSATTIQNSLTIILVGIYLLVVGVLAHLTRYVPGSTSLPLDAFIVFLSLTALAVLLLSNRFRRRLRLFVSRHFRRPIYDYRSVWMELAARTTSLVDANELSTAVSRMVSESLEILSVSVWLVDDSQRKLTLAGSTAFSSSHAKVLEKAGKSAPDFIGYFREHPGFVDLHEHDLSWPKEIMDAVPDCFSEFSMRFAVGLHAGGDMVGIMTLNDDRVGRDVSMSAEDLTLVETLAAQLASGLLNLRLSDRLRKAKEVETFQTVSTFFVHDLKNLASRLSLTMQNLPANFDNPEFRADALRVISTSLANIDEMCGRLALLKNDIDLQLEECDFNRLVSTTLAEFEGSLKAELEQDLQPVPRIRMDCGQIRKVLTNLVMNASEAVNGNGIIHVATLHEGNSVGFAIRDNGCGMSEEFIDRSLFRPFQTTKQKGLGIGLFHSKMIVEAHRGAFEVSSAVGIGTEFRMILPIGQ